MGDDLSGGGGGVFEGNWRYLLRVLPRILFLDLNAAPLAHVEDVLDERANLLVLHDLVVTEGEQETITLVTGEGGDVLGEGVPRAAAARRPSLPSSCRLVIS